MPLSAHLHSFLEIALSRDTERESCTDIGLTTAILGQAAHSNFLDPSDSSHLTPTTKLIKADGFPISAPMVVTSLPPREALEVIGGVPDSANAFTQFNINTHYQHLSVGLKKEPLSTDE